MPMDLIRVEYHRDGSELKIRHEGTQSFSLPAGQHLRVQTGPPIVTELDAIVPAGKTWNLIVTVYVDEV